MRLLKDFHKWTANDIAGRLGYLEFGFYLFHNAVVKSEIDGTTVVCVTKWKEISWMPTIFKARGVGRPQLQKVIDKLVDRGKAFLNIDEVDM